MLEAVFWFVGDVVCYGVGRWVLLVLSLGRYDSCRRKTSEGLVSLLGLAVLLPGVILGGAWLAKL